MRVYCIGETDPYWNLAMEEAALRSCTDGDYLLLWRNAPSVIVGRYQNTVEEIDQNYVRDRGLPVVRRITGGGCVYHDLGNLNYSYITDAGDAEELSIARFTRPVVEALRALGVPAELTGRNDILAGGKKISGCAQVIEGKRILHHGTLLFSASLEDAARALRVHPEKYRSKSTKSVRTRIGNISEVLSGGKIRSVLEFRDYLADCLGSGGEHFFPGAELLAEAGRLAKEKYRSWEWNYGESPPFQYHDKKGFSCGLIELSLSVEEGRIAAVMFRGDFLARRRLSELEERLQGCALRREALSGRLADAPLEEYFGTISAGELAAFLAGVETPETRGGKLNAGNG